MRASWHWVVALALSAFGASAARAETPRTEDAAVRPVIVSLRDAPEGDALRVVQHGVLGRLGRSVGDDVTLFRETPALSLFVTDDEVRRLATDPDVSSVDDDPILKPIAGPGTEFRGFFLSQTTQLIGANEMWRSGYEGAGRNIAILDAGVDKTARPLRGKVVDEACFSTQQGSAYESLCREGAAQDLGPGSAEPCPSSLTGCEHGTHLAAAATANPRSTGENEFGVAREAGLISLKVASKQKRDVLCSPNPAPCARVRTSDLMRGLEYLYGERTRLAIGAIVVSLAEAPSAPPCSGATPFQRLIDKMNRARLPVVAGAGNDGLLNVASFPACVRGVVSVGSTGKIHTPDYLIDMVPASSNLDDDLTLMAPGEKIRTFLGNVSGTSMSAAHVAGAITLMRSFQPAGKLEPLLAALECNGDLVERDRFVHTRVNVLRAAQYLGPEGPPPVSQSFNSAGPPINWVSVLGTWGTRAGTYRLLDPSSVAGSYSWSGAATGVCGSEFEISTQIKRVEPEDGPNYNTAIVLATDLPTVEGQTLVSGYFFSFNKQGGPHMQLLRLDDYNFNTLAGSYEVLCDKVYDFDFGDFLNFYLRRSGDSLLVGVNGLGACSFNDATYKQFKSVVVFAAHAPGDATTEVILRDIKIKTLKR